MEIGGGYLPGDPHLVEKIVCDLKSQGVFDQFRKECFADVDTKPAYQNLRQRVEGSVTGFLREQSWRPDMNKNQVREMLRKKISESGYLDTGVERIVDQVVNPKINSVFLPKVEEIVYSFLGIQKPTAKGGDQHLANSDLLPNDLEAVSPEHESIIDDIDVTTDQKPEEKVKPEEMVVEKKEVDEKVVEEAKEEVTMEGAETKKEEDEEDSKMEEDESPPFEPLEEQVVVTQEENSIDSQHSYMSALVSQESNQSNDVKQTLSMELDSQISRNSSDSRLSIVTSDDNSKLEVATNDPSKTSTTKKIDRNDVKSKSRDHKDKEKDRDRDRKSSSSKSRHSNTSSKDKDKDSHRDRDVAKSKDKDCPSKDKDRHRKDSSSKSSSHRDKDSRSRTSSSSKHTSSGGNGKKESSSTSSKDRRERDRSRHGKHGSSHHHHSSSSRRDDKRQSKTSEDRCGDREKRTERRSTDRDSNDGSGKSANVATNQNSTTQSDVIKSTNENGGGAAGGGGSTGGGAKEPTVAPPVDGEKSKIMKPKCASNIQEALRLMKIRKQLAKLEKENQLGLASVDTRSLPESSVLEINDLVTVVSNGADGAEVGCEAVKRVEEAVVEKPKERKQTVLSADLWQAMEEKLQAKVFNERREAALDEEGRSEEDEDIVEDKVVVEENVVKEKREKEDDQEEEVRYFKPVDTDKIEFLVFVKRYIANVEMGMTAPKRKSVDDLMNNNEKKVEENAVVEKKKRKSNIVNTQRYSSDDLYKPRSTFTSRRRAARTSTNTTE